MPPTKSKSDISKLLDDEPASNNDVPDRSLAGFPIVPPGEMGKNLNILIYGEPGVGKTVLAGSASTVEDMSPVLLLDVEGGTMSLTDQYGKVDVIRIHKWTDLQKIYNQLYAGNHDYKTVIMDSLSEAQKLSMTDIMAKAVKDDPDLDRDVPTMRAWGQNLEQMRRFTRGLRDLPMNVIFTALVETDKNNKGKTAYRPLFQGKTKGEVPGFMDIVAYYYMLQKGEETRRMLLTHQTDTVIAKDRSNQLPKLIESPTMEVIHGYITGTLSKSADSENTEDKTEEKK